MTESERESSVEWGDPVLILAKADYHQRRWWNRSEEEKDAASLVLTGLIYRESYAKVMRLWDKCNPQ